MALWGSERWALKEENRAKATGNVSPQLSPQDMQMTMWDIEE
jgi:hypothetical protein